MIINVNTLSLRDLEYLVTVGETKHFGHAAVKCHVSQPALSSQIKKVEGFLGTQIFERTNRKVTVTETGRLILEQARKVLDEARKLQDLAGKKRAPLTGSLRLGAIASLGPYYIPHLLSPLKKAYPQLDLNLIEGLTEDLLRSLKAGELDVVLASPTFDPRGFHVIPVFFEPFLFLAPKNHPILSKGHVRAADLKAEEMVLLEDGHCLKDQALELCPSNRRGNVRTFHATSLETLKALVATNHGYTLMPSLAVNTESELKDLIRYKKVEGKDIGRTIALVCRENFGGMKDVAALAELIRKSVPKGLSRIQDAGA